MNLGYKEFACFTLVVCFSLPPRALVSIVILTVAEFNHSSFFTTMKTSGLSDIKKQHENKKLYKIEEVKTGEIRDGGFGPYHTLPIKLGRAPWLEGKKDSAIKERYKTPKTIGLCTMVRGHQTRSFQECSVSTLFLAKMQFIIERMTYLH